MSCDKRCFEKDGDYAGFDACDICLGRDDGTSLEQRKREERLYRAAPELLEALKVLLDASERHIFGDECKAERDAARAAIAKAEGA